MPAAPDLFSMYGIRNIGQALSKWSNLFVHIDNITQAGLKALYPSECVKFLGYTIYNAKRRKDQKLGLAGAHRNYAEEIPSEVVRWIPPNYVSPSNSSIIGDSIGKNAVWYTHNTYPTLAQKYKCPIWAVPDNKNLDASDRSTVTQNKQRFYDIYKEYETFSNDLMSRVR